jgi:hypothetical protein
MPGIEDMPSQLAEAHQIGCRFEIELCGGKIFHRLRRVLADTLPGVDYRLFSDHRLSLYPRVGYDASEGA